MNIEGVTPVAGLLNVNRRLARPPNLLSAPLLYL
jgi:hypothetical protein